MEQEEAIIRAFVVAARRDRWLTLLGKPRRRAAILNRLNHQPDFDPRYARHLPSTVDVAALLRPRGAPPDYYVISDSKSLDVRVMSVVEAVSSLEMDGLGTLISCIPGRLAYYYGEQGEQRILLERLTT